MFILILLGILASIPIILMTMVALYLLELDEDISNSFLYENKEVDNND